MVERVLDTPRALAVHDLDAIGPTPEGVVDLVHDLRKRLFDGQAVQVHATGWRGFN